MKIRWGILLGIVLLAGFLRFWQLASLPPSLYWDEVSQGYNAYSILTTGKDEHQEFLPLARFQAFGDYKAPVNIYLTVPAIMSNQGFFRKATNKNITPQIVKKVATFPSYAARDN